MIQITNATKFFETSGEKKYILKNVTLTIPSGVNIGILGRNGAGKSTLLRMLGGIEFPSVGNIVSNQTFSWPMGLAGGFQGSMTGRQNVKFVCRIYGKTDSEIKEIISFVESFAEIGDYFNMPIKIYSSGMRSRLSFGLSLAFDFDYLIIDETLSVGDENFKKKAKSALEKKIENCNVILVSHSMNDLRKICDAGIVVDNGKLYYFENIDDAIDRYYELNKSQPSLNDNTIFCSDGKTFCDVNEIAKHYKVRPMSIIQALEENNGSHHFLKLVFYKANSNKLPYQDWHDIVKNKTLISSDGTIFSDCIDAALFYMDRMPNIDINKDYISNIMQKENGNASKLNLKFYYLSEFKK